MHALPTIGRARLNAAVIEHSGHNVIRAVKATGVNKKTVAQRQKGAGLPSPHSEESESAE